MQCQLTCNSSVMADYGIGWKHLHIMISLFLIAVAVRWMGSYDGEEFAFFLLAPLVPKNLDKEKDLEF